MGFPLKVRFSICVLAVVCALGWAMPVQADGPSGQEPSIDGCGKAHAVIAG